MKRTLKYFLNLLVLFVLLLPLNAQDGMRVRGPRISYDLGSLALLYFDPDRMVYTISVDYEIKQDIYAVIDLGYQQVNINRDNYKYSSSGMFTRLGADVNLLNYDKQVDVYEMMYVGGRYGFSLFNQQAQNISIPDPYWGDFSDGQIKKYNLNAHWISLVGGMKAEVFRNFFMGWSVYLNIRFYTSGGKDFETYNIPGFGKGGNRATATFNYTISYRIPMRYYTPKIKARKE